MENIKDKIDKYKNSNGNQNISNKDLLFYVLARLDDIEKSSKGLGTRITKIETRQKLFLWSTAPIIAAIGLLYMVLF